MNYFLHSEKQYPVCLVLRLGGIKSLWFSMVGKSKGRRWPGFASLLGFDERRCVFAGRKGAQDP